jgi:hypothetical protein
MSKKKQKSNPQRNLVAKYARDFNKSSSQLSKKDKQKHKAPKHKHDD